MIAGETEAILNRYSEDYDEFFHLFKKKKKKKELTLEEKQELTDRRNKFWSETRRSLKNFAALGVLKKGGTGEVTYAQMSPPAVGYHDISLSKEMADKTESESKDSSSFTYQLVGGIILVVCLGLFGYYSSKRTPGGNAPNSD